MSHRDRYVIDAEYRAGWFFLCFSPKRVHGDDKHKLTDAQFRQLAEGKTIAVGTLVVTPTGPLRSP